jgi:hypothetical protein
MCEETNLIFDVSVQIFGTSDLIPIDRYCNSLTVRNTGAAGSVVILKGITLAVGEAFTFGGNRREIMRGRFDLVLTGANAQATVVEKFYTGEKDCTL